MTIKIDQPLFGDTASGRIRGVGSFRQTTGGTFLVPEPGGNTTPNLVQQQQRNSFTDAKAAHSEIIPSSVFAGGRYRRRRIPSWPDFWAQWLINNPGFSSRRASLQSQIGGFALAATAIRPRSLYMSPGQIADFSLTATARRTRQLVLDTGQIGAFVLTGTAIRPRSLYMAPGQIGGFALTATAIRPRSLYMAPGQIGGFALTVTAQRG